MGSLTALFLMTSIALLAVSRRVHGVDETRTPEARGSVVVQTVVDLIRSNCIFSSDRLFLRRLAYVETKDGTEPNTYRPGYDGGIWQVDEDMFNSTLTCSVYMTSACNIIRQEFGIEWRTVTWSDLRKPLYSGLAATLYILLQLRSLTPVMPADVPGQQSFWNYSYHHGQAPNKNFTQLALEATDYNCTKPMDIAFIIDSSGSIADADFQLSLGFVAEVVEDMDIPTVVRVAVLTFETAPLLQFNFNRYSTKSEVTAAIRNIRKISGGTSTYLALDAARTTIFQTARVDAMKVAVLLTDGQSGSINLTVAAADRLKQSGVTVFAIGIGGYYLPELKGVATDPNCSYVFTLSSFSEIDSIKFEIQKSTCEASVTLSNESFTATPNEGQGTYVISTTSSGGEGSSPPPSGVIMSTTCYLVDMYVSYTNPNPSPAHYSDKYFATNDHPAYVTIDPSQSGRPMYITVIKANGESDLDLSNCTYTISLIEKGVEVQCCDGNECRQCTPTDLRPIPGIIDTVCGSVSGEWSNPCTPESLQAGQIIYPFPNDVNKFIRCAQGVAYVTLCPYSQTFNRYSLSCGYQAPVFSERTPLPYNYPNPCTITHIQAQYFFFEYTPDRHRFIHCDLWGNAWLQYCPTNEIWDQAQLTCVTERPTVVVTTKRPITVVNPCTAENLAQGILFHPYPCDHTRYIHCDVSGNYYVQACPGGLYYDPITYICVVGDPQHSGGCEQ